MPMTWLELYHLRRLCEKYEIDFDSEVDLTLTYGENKAHILNLAHQLGRHVDEDDMLDEIVDAWADRTWDMLVENVIEIIESEERTIGRILKQMKYDVGKRILRDHEWLTREYGGNYFGRLARRIGKRGWSPDQLRKCVKFAQEPEENARRLIQDDNIGWEYIRRHVLSEIQFLSPFGPEFQWQGCPAVTTRLSEIAQINSLCRDKNCVLYKLCRRISKEVESLTQLPLRQSQT